MTQTTLTVPAGTDAVIGSDGERYAAVAGQVTMPANAVPAGMFGAGFHTPSAGGGSSSGTSGAVQTSDGAGGFDNIGTLAAALAALGVYPPATVVLTMDQVANLHLTKVEGVATRGAGKVLFPSNWSAWFAGNGGYLPGSSVPIQAVWTTGDNQQALMQTGIDPITAAGTGTNAVVDHCGTDIGDTNVDGSSLSFVAASQIEVIGGIATASLGSSPSGSGWVVGNTFEVSDPWSLGGTKAAGIVDAVSGGGVTAFHLTSAGNIYANSNTNPIPCTATSGVGIGLTIIADTFDYTTNPATVSITTQFTVKSV